MTTKKPGLLDIVEIDGRLAQVYVRNNKVGFLDERARGHQELYEINWCNYEHTPAEKIISVSLLLEKGMISTEEYESVYWGSEQKKHPHLKGEVTYFGSYKSIKE